MKFASLFTGSRVALATLASVLSMAVCQAQTPVAHWTFDDNVNDYTQTTVSDEQTAGGTSDAVWADADSNDLAYTRGKIGGAVRLSGGGSNWFVAGDIPEIANTVALPDFGQPDSPAGTGVTVAGWLYSFNAGSSFQGVLSSLDATIQRVPAPGTDVPDQKFGMGYSQSSDTLNARADDISPAGSVAGDTGPFTWHHFAYVWGDSVNPLGDTSGIFEVPGVLYLNGVEVGRNDNTNVAKLISSGSFNIGQDDGRAFVGLLDDLAIYDSALTASQLSTIVANGNSGVNASGVNTQSIAVGDADGDGDADMDDFNAIRDNLGKVATGRNMGDLDGSRKVDLNDFQEWLEAAPAALHAPALAALSGVAVPEPASVLIVGLGLAVGGFCRYRSQQR